MNIDEFCEIDKTFNEGIFLSEVNNVFIKLLSSVMLDNLDEVRHFIGSDVYDYIYSIIKNNKDNRTRQMYDELNVKNSNIQSIEVKDNVYIIKVYLQSRYMNYIINLSNGNYVSGNDSSRIQVNYLLTFEKKANFKDSSITRKCPGCSASIDVNNSGKCKYCGTIYNQDDYGWVLTKLEVLN